MQSYYARHACAKWTFLLAAFPTCSDRPGWQVAPDRDLAHPNHLEPPLHKKRSYTQMQSLWRPAIRAQLALDQTNPTSLSALQAASPIETDNETFPKDRHASIAWVCHPGDRLASSSD